MRRVLAGILLLCGLAHGYVTLSAGLGAALELQADSTYYLTANVTLGAYNLTSAGTAAKRVTIKTVGNVGFQVNSTGTLNLAYVDFTSKNDNSLGATITGSSGSPAATDQTVGYVLRTGTDATSVTIDNFSIRYTNCNTNMVVGWTANAATSPLTLTNGSFQNITVTSGTRTLIGNNGNNTNGNVTIRNVAIGASVTFSSAAETFVFRDNAVMGNWIFDRVYVCPSGAPKTAVYLNQPNAGVSISVSVAQSVFICSGAEAVLGVRVNGGTASIATTIANTIVSNTGASHGINIRRGNGTHTASVTNCIIYDCDGAGIYGLSAEASTTVTHTNNGYWNNTTNAFEALHASEFIANPNFGALPAGAVQNTALTNFPTTYAVRNLSAYERKGSATFDALSIDENTYSATGYRYSGTTNVTPGVNYALIGFGKYNIASSTTYGRRGYRFAVYSQQEYSDN